MTHIPKVGQTPDLVELALHVALNFHAGQKDRSGQPYILHPLAVTLTLTDPTEQAAAILHDVVEDTPATITGLGEMFPSEVVRLVDALTRRPDEKYRAYIDRIKAAGPAAIRIKVADLRHNLSPTRAAGSNPGLEKRYRAALTTLGAE